jgi:nucleoside-diphosphate-sugar epimerase
VIAILGASGFVGHHLVEALNNYGSFEMKVLVHSTRDLELFNKPNIKIIEGDCTIAESLEKLVEPGCTVVNLVYLSNKSKRENLKAIDNLAIVCGKVKIKRFIHCSTATVVGKVRNKIIDETTLCNPINEYEITKLEIEKTLLERYGNLFELVVLRPTAIFGPGGKNLVRLANDITSGKRILNYMKSCLFYFRRMNLVYIDNVIASLVFLIAKDEIFEKEIFIISDDDYVTNNFRYVEKFLMKKFDFKDYLLPPVPLPFFILAFLLRIMGQSNSNPIRAYKCQKILNAGFSKPVLFDEGLAKFADWYEEKFLHGNSL